MNKPVTEPMTQVAAIPRGHYNYYGVSGNFTALNAFCRHMRYLVHKMLKRRSQRKSIT